MLKILVCINSICIHVIREKYTFYIVNKKEAKKIVVLTLKSPNEV